MKCDVLIVGAGFSGLVIAERLSNELGKHCIVVDKRDHIGGNAYDYHDEAGVLVHKYGPHYFHTNSEKILKYLSRFTEWNSYFHVAKSFSEGKIWSFPVNLMTFEQMLDRPSTTEEMEKYLTSHRENIDHPANLEESIVSQVGWELYNRFYKGYTTKQWGRDPKDLAPSVCSRIPVRTTRNENYSDEKFQCMPAKGYTKMFEEMLRQSPRVQVLLGQDYKALQCEHEHLVYTGPIDEFFDYAHGPLLYRSLRFEHESFGPEALKEGFWQGSAQVNYPNSEGFTRIIEMKHSTKQVCENSTIVREYPEVAFGREPYYPVPAPDTDLKYAHYKELADRRKDVTFVGRLATYRYYSMDQVVGAALSAFERLRRTLDEGRNGSGDAPRAD